jgi:Tlde1 domain
MRSKFFDAADRRGNVGFIVSQEAGLVAAAIAVLITFGIEGTSPTYFKADDNLKADGNCCARYLGDASADLARPVARANASLVLRGPLRSEAPRQRQVERISNQLVPGGELFDRASFGEAMLSVPLPQPRPLIKQVRSDTASSSRITPKPTTHPSAAGSSTFLVLLKNFFARPRKDAFPAEAVGRTAVYDIKGRVVYLPNGEKIEAHSGLGKWLDDARYVNEKDLGPTPPNTYRLSLRNELFHGVQAIRLNPVSSSNMYGRSGFLVHPYMLGPNGQSNGCVSLQDYPKFLEAFLRGDIDRLIVIPDSSAPVRVATRAATRTDLSAPLVQDGAVVAQQ